MVWIVIMPLAASVVWISSASRRGPLLWYVVWSGGVCLPTFGPAGDNVLPKAIARGMQLVNTVVWCFAGTATFLTSTAPDPKIWHVGIVAATPALVVVAHWMEFVAFRPANTGGRGTRCASTVACATGMSLTWLIAGLGFWCSR